MAPSGEVVKIRLLGEWPHEKDFATGISPARRASRGGLGAGGVVVNCDPQAFDTGEHREGGNAACRDERPDGRGRSELGREAKGERRFYTLTDAKSEPDVGVAG